METSEDTIGTIQEGDTVCLRAGGVPMRVLAVYEKDGVATAETEYWDGAQNHREIHPCDALVARKPDVEEE